MVEAKTEFGLFKVVNYLDPEICDDVAQKLNLSQTDHVLELHIPENWADCEPHVLLRIAGNSFRELAKYLVEQDESPRFVVGVTYAPLALAAKMFGFTVEPFRTKNRDFISRVEDQFRMNGFKERNSRRRARPFICFIDGDQFIKRFSEKPKMSSRALLARLGFTV